MNHAQVKPALDRTLYTQRHAIYVALLLAAFVLVLTLYMAYGRLRTLQQEAGTPAETQVKMPLYGAYVPGGWEGYVRSEHTLHMMRRVETASAHLLLCTDANPAYAYRALDVNPAFVARHLAHQYETVFHSEVAIDLHGTEIIPCRPGVPAVHFFFRVANKMNGEGLLFYVKDVEFLVWGIAPLGETDGMAEIKQFLRNIFATMILPEVRELFSRPVIHSGRITYEQGHEVCAAAGKELTLARQHASRCEVAPEGNLVPALTHYGEALSLLSSVRQEDDFLGSQEFSRFERLTARRLAQIREWFLLLEKCTELRDIKGARKQAQFILDHATLDDEVMDRRRAHEILRSLPEPTASKE
ncbi:MAG: hypothetical protein RR417_03080 [Kiritimatiellia bacterium]